ncbi:uncharacterized protein LOC127260885 [Andrographis paniculata]|uniref:uncharacterized protein LOC127260885 n=1 Tax=Andrographis paniculata TaxID=175694 RepID=UPI0021E6E96D|nr:uncharacterized protein LOC127260885 [Andrographis paniculata]
MPLKSTMSVAFDHFTRKLFTRFFIFDAVGTVFFDFFFPLPLVLLISVVGLRKFGTMNSQLRKHDAELERFILSSTGTIYRKNVEYSVLQTCIGEWCLALEAECEVAEESGRADDRRYLA